MAKLQWDVQNLGRNTQKRLDDQDQAVTNKRRVIFEIYTNIGEYVVNTLINVTIPIRRQIQEVNKPLRHLAHMVVNRATQVTEQQAVRQFHTLASAGTHRSHAVVNRATQTTRQQAVKFTHTIRLSRTLAATVHRTFSSQSQCVQSPLHSYLKSDVPPPYSVLYKKPKYFTPMAHAILSHHASKVQELVTKGWTLEKEREASRQFGVTTDISKDMVMYDIKMKGDSFGYSDSVIFVLEHHYWNHFKHPMNQVYEIMRKFSNLSYEDELDQKIKEGNFSTVRYLLIKGDQSTDEKKHSQRMNFISPILKRGTAWRNARAHSEDYINRLRAISYMLQGDMSMPQDRNWKYSWDQWE